MLQAISPCSHVQSGQAGRFWVWQVILNPDFAGLWVKHSYPKWKLKQGLKPAVPSWPEVDPYPNECKKLATILPHEFPKKKPLKSSPQVRLPRRLFFFDGILLSRQSALLKLEQQRLRTWKLDQSPSDKATWNCRWKGLQALTLKEWNDLPASCGIGFLQDAET